MELRFASPEDARACNHFYNSNYGTTRTEAQWAWEFVRPNPPGDLPFSVAFEQGEVVGTQALIPIRFIDERGTFLTAKSEETLVSPTMRGKDLLGSLYEPLFRLANDRDFKSIWGFTPAERAFRKLKFDIPDTTKQLFLACSAGSLAAVAGSKGEANKGARGFLLSLAGFGLSIWSRLLAPGAGARLAAGESLQSLEDASLFDDAFSRRFIETWGGTTILRDHAYMTWRLFENPHRRANVVAVVKEDRLMGYVAFALGNDGTGYVVDIMSAHGGGRADDARITRILLAECVRRLKRMGAACIRGWTFNDHPFDALVRRVARRCGFVRINRGNAVVFHHGYVDDKRATSHDDFGNWYVNRIFTEGVDG